MTLSNQDDAITVLHHHISNFGFSSLNSDTMLILLLNFIIAIYIFLDDAIIGIASSRSIFWPFVKIWYSGVSFDKIAKYN